MRSTIRDNFTAALEASFHWIQSHGLRAMPWSGIRFPLFGLQHNLSFWFVVGCAVLIASCRFSLPSSETPISPHVTSSQTQSSVAPPYATTVFPFEAADLALISADNANQMTLLQRWDCGNIRTLGWLPNGQILALSAIGLSVWQGPPWVEVKVIPNMRPVRFDNLAISHNGRIAAFGGSDGSVDVWDIESGSRLQTILPPSGFSPDSAHERLFALSPEGNIIAISAAAPDHDRIYLIDTANGDTILTLEFYTPYTTEREFLQPHSISFSPNGELLAADNGGDVLVWNVATGEIVRKIEQNADGGGLLSASYTAIGHDSSYVVALYAGDENIRVFDITTGELLHKWPLSMEYPKKFSISIDGSFITVAYSNGNEVLETASGHVLASDRLSTISLSNNALSLDGSQLVGVDTDTGAAFIWGVADGPFLWQSTDKAIWKALGSRQFEALRANCGLPVHAAFTPAGDRLVSGHRNASQVVPGDMSSTELVRDVFSGQVIQEWEDSSSARERVLVVSPDGKVFATVAFGETIRIWDALTGTLLWTLQTNKTTVGHIVFSQDSKTLISNDSVGTISLWDIRSGHLLTSWAGVSECTNACSGELAIDPTGHDLIVLVRSIFSSQGAWIWDMPSGDGIGSIPVSDRSDEYQIESFSAVKYSPSGQVIAIGSDDGWLRLWDAVTTQPLFSGHCCGGRIEELVFSPDGGVIVTRTSDNILTVWDTLAGELIATYTGVSSVHTMTFDQSGHLFITAHNDGAIGLWGIPPN